MEICWQGQGGNTTPTKQNKIVALEEQQCKRNNNDIMRRTTNVKLVST
jgi:hypothetical protein